MRIRLDFGTVAMTAELADTDCARAIGEALPVEAPAERWGEEFYFAIPVKHDLDATATRTVRVGDLGYWPPGEALCVFFGRTPDSTGDDPVAASEVNVVGRVVGDATALLEVEGLPTVRVAKA